MALKSPAGPPPIMVASYRGGIESELSLELLAVVLGIVGVETEFFDTVVKLEVCDVLEKG